MRKAAARKVCVAGRSANGVRFVERFEPDPRSVLDIEADRLIVRHQGGDAAALTELYLQHFDGVFRYAKVSLRDAHEAEDIAQQVFTVAVHRAREYRIGSGASFRGWLLATTRNAVLAQQRDRGRMQVRQPEHVARLRESETVDFDVALRWISDQDLAFFVEHLPSTQRDVLVLRYMLNLSTDSIADAMRKSPRAIRDLHRRGLRTLESRLLAIGRKPLRSRRMPTLTRLKLAPVLARRRFALEGSFTPAGQILSAGLRRWG